MPYNEDDEYDLSEFEIIFQKANKKKQIVEPPDDRYKVRVTKAEIVRSQRKGIPILRWILTVVDGKYAGEALWKSNAFTTVGAINVLKSDLAVFNIEISTIRQLPRVVPQLIGKIIEVEKKTNLEMYSVFIKELVEMDDETLKPAFDLFECEDLDDLR